jgi:hypothetical protein
MTTEQVLITSDGLLTRATDKIPHSARARRIVVTAHNTMNNNKEVAVIIGTTGKLTWRSDQPQMVRSVDGYMWEGGVWMFTDTTTWFLIPFIAGKSDSRGVPTSVAATADDASVEQLRTLMIHWLSIRPVITFDVCEIVKQAVKGTFVGAQAWRAVKSNESTKEQP